MQIPVYYLLIFSIKNIFFYFLIFEVLAVNLVCVFSSCISCSLWQVHMDLLNIGTVDGSGQLLLVSHHLRDISMRQQVLVSLLYFSELNFFILFVIRRITFMYVSRSLLMHGFMCLEGRLVGDAWQKTHQVLQVHIYKL